jgi:hypothetical protein
MSEHVTLKTNQAALHQLHQGLAMGVHELAQAVVTEAMPRKPKEATVGVVTMLDGAILEGTTQPPAGAGGGQIVAFAVFGSPSAYEEFGTPAHDIVSKNNKMLKLPDGRFARRIHHPGGKPKPFITPAVFAANAASESHLRRGIAKRYR